MIPPDLIITDFGLPRGPNMHPTTDEEYAASVVTIIESFGGGRKFGTRELVEFRELVRALDRNYAAAVGVAAASIMLDKVLDGVSMTFGANPPLPLWRVLECQNFEELQAAPYSPPRGSRY